MNKHIKGRAPNAWNEKRRAESETRILSALKGNPMSRADLVKACGLSDATIWRKVDTLLMGGHIVDAEPRIGANRCQERVFQLCDPLKGPVPIQKKPKKIETVSRDPFIAMLFGSLEARPATEIPRRVHHMADDEMEAA